MRVYRRVWAGQRDRGDRGIFRNVGILPDGALHNPNGYPDDEVRAAVLAADERRRVRRSDAAKKAAATRRDRHSRLVYSVARKISEGREYGPRQNCVVCGKGLTDPESVARGVGSDCWQCVLEAISQSQAAKQPTLV
jgi:Family of unknown function (DUF6011)